MKNILLSLLIIFLISCTPYWERELYPLELNGIIENTFIDYSDHAIRVVVVKEVNELKEFYVWKDYNHSFYQKIQIGDSIFKKANSLEFNLKKNGVKRKYIFEKYP